MTADSKARDCHHGMVSDQPMLMTLNVYAAAHDPAIEETATLIFARSKTADGIDAGRAGHPEWAGSDYCHDVLVRRKPGIAISASAKRCKQKNE